MLGQPKLAHAAARKWNPEAEPVREQGTGMLAHVSNERSMPRFLLRSKAPLTAVRSRERAAFQNARLFALLTRDRRDCAVATSARSLRSERGPTRTAYRVPRVPAERLAPAPPRDA